MGCGVVTLTGTIAVLRTHLHFSERHDCAVWKIFIKLRYAIKIHGILVFFLFSTFDAYYSLHQSQLDTEQFVEKTITRRNPFNSRGVNKL